MKHLLSFFLLIILIAFSHHVRYIDVGDTQLELFEFDNITFPNSQDKELVNHLDPIILHDVSKFLYSNRLVEQDAWQIEAARFYKSLLLLDIDPSKRWYDNNRFFVYSVKEHEIVGVFVWYSQG